MGTLVRPCRKLYWVATQADHDSASPRSNWECLGQWTLFASPVKHVSRLESDDASPPSLLNAVAFVSANSPVAFVSLFPPQHLFTLPGTKSSVDLVATSREEVLVLYRQGLARVCDIKSRELRRSMDRRTAESVVADGDWHIWYDTRQWLTVLAADICCLCTGSGPKRRSDWQRPPVSAVSDAADPEMKSRAYPGSSTQTCCGWTCVCGWKKLRSKSHGPTARTARSEMTTAGPLHLWSARRKTSTKIPY